MKSIARHRSRERAIQAIYSWQLSGNSINDITKDFLSEQDMSDVDVPYFCELLNGISTNVLKLDKTMAPYLSRQLSKLGQIEKAILRLAIFELYYRNDVPYKVAINEAVELAKNFGAEKSYKFINGALDNIFVNVFKKK